MFQFYLLGGAVGVGMVLVLYGTIAKNDWGINLSAVSCPQCGTPLPRVRKAQSLRQMLWGGATCPNCETEVDKWGREIRPKIESGIRRNVAKKS